MDAPTAWSERCRQLVEPIEEVCGRLPVASGPVALTRELARVLPEWRFRETLCRGGWYRLGGVVAEDGRRVADRLGEWAAEALDACGGDMGALFEEFADSALRATVLSGRSHFLVAPIPGGGATDFLQLELEDLQETGSHRLFQRERLPGTLDELVDCRCGAAGLCGDERCGVPLAAPRYRFRRLVHVGDVIARMRAQSLDLQPIHHFVADWEASSAASTVLCNHWVISLRDHLDRYRQTITRATPVPAVHGELPRLEAREDTSGLSLHGALTAYDRAVGYPMAWFFSLVCGQRVPHWVVSSVLADNAAGFSYLPERDLQIIRRWVHNPYYF